MLGHTNQEFESELRELKDKLLSMGGRCERAIDLAVRALLERDADLALKVEEEDRFINADELEIDNLAERIFALRQPMGRDLRFALSALKVVTDLERIGDEAVNLAERTRELATGKEAPPPWAHVPSMAENAAFMLREALDAFLEEDADRARAVLTKDDEVDAIYGQILRESKAYMASNPERIEGGMALCSSAKYLERIADHATNIAEMVVYLARGEDVRHRGNAGTR